MARMAKAHQQTFGIRVGRKPSRTDTKREYALFWKRMKPFVATVVIKSFADPDGGMRNPKMSDVEERTSFCKKLVDELRNDMGWSIQRIRDHLPLVLRARLAGISIPIEAMAKRATW